MSWNAALSGPGAYANQTWYLGSMAAGPEGHVAIGTHAESSVGCHADLMVLDAAGAPAGGASKSATTGATHASIWPSSFDPQDNLLYEFIYGSGVVSGFVTSGFTAPNASISYSFSSYWLSQEFYGGSSGRDAAGHTYLGALVKNIDFGQGAVSGNVLLHWDPAGTFLGSMPEPPGSFTVGALGHLYFTRSVTGSVDDGCGPVGAASTASTVLTKRDPSGACLWSKALPAGTAFALDPLEDVLFAAPFSGTVDFGGGPLVAAGTSDLAVAKLDATGTLLWSNRFGASGANLSGLHALAATNAGGAALSVNLSGAVDFGCGPVAPSVGTGTLIASFDAAGDVIYSRLVSVPFSTTTLYAADGLGGVTIATQPSGSKGAILVSRYAP